MGPAGPNCNPRAPSVLVFQAAILADADALAVLAQLLEAGLLALAGLEAFGGSFMRRSHGAMTFRIFLLFLAAVLLGKYRPGQRYCGRRGEPTEKSHIASCALKRFLFRRGR